MTIKLIETVIGLVLTAGMMIYTSLLCFFMMKDDKRK